MDAEWIALLALIAFEGAAGIVWAIRQEGRLNAVDEIAKQRSAHKQAQIDSLKEEVSEIRGEYRALTSKLIEDVRHLSEGIVEIKTILRERDRDRDRDHN